MGPRSFERGDTPSPVSSSPSTDRFNGAALFRARRHVLWWGKSGSSKGFNGAALFRARRPAKALALAATYHSFNGAALFRARRPARSVFPLFRGPTLQWGRALSSAETGPQWKVYEAGLEWSFNGAALFRARRHAAGTYLRGRSAHASMGPRSFERGDGCAMDRQAGPGVASMGPRSFERGDLGGLRAGLMHATPSMGPRSFERGDTGEAVPSVSRVRPFNGAALFRARRRGAPPGNSENASTPSMGPRSFERGDGDGRRLGAREVIYLQWGRALSSAETALLPSVSEQPPRLQWGRALSSAETTECA